MSFTICVANQKGGVGKSTIVFHLSGALAEAGYRVLAIDLDQQGNLSSGFLQDIYSLEKTVTNLFLDDDCHIEDVIIDTHIENIALIPANLDFSSIDLQLASEIDAQYLLADYLSELESTYDFILLDCPPSLGLATRNGLVTSQGVIIPIECQEWASRGSSHLRLAMEKVQRRANPGLDLLGYLISKFDMRRKLENTYKDKLYELFGAQVFESTLRNTVRYSESILAKQPITSYMPDSEYAQAYRELVKEIQARIKTTESLAA